MSEAETALVFRIRSNAHSLVAGSGVESVRRRIKAGSLLYDEVLLEAGVAHLQAGPHAASNMHLPSRSGVRPRWQTPAQRGKAMRSEFWLAFGQEDTRGLLEIIQTWLPWPSAILGRACRY
jgi:hypothetical protein